MSCFAAESIQKPHPHTTPLPTPCFSQEFKPNAVLTVLEKVADRYMSDKHIAMDNPVFALGWKEFCSIANNPKYKSDLVKTTAETVWSPEEYKAKTLMAGDGPKLKGKTTARKVAGLAHFMPELAKNGESRKKFTEAFANGAASLRDKQGPDGFWRVNLQKEQHPIDITTSAFATYATAAAVNQMIGMNWLDSARLKVIFGWRALVSAVGPDGSIRFGIPSADQETEAVGAFLLAGAQVYKMAKEMTEYLPFVVSEEYQADLAHQKARIAEEPEPTRERTLAAMRKVCEWQLGNLFKGSNGKGSEDAQAPDRSWFRGALLTGVILAARMTQDDFYWKLAEKISEENKWQPGPNFFHDGNDLAITQAYLALYIDKEKDPKRIEATRAALDSLLVKGGDGKGEWSWADALFMAPAAWAQMSIATGDPRYINHMNLLWWDSVEHLQDKKDRFFYRDYTYMVQPNGFQITERNGKKVYWSRGNGWVIGGLCNVLEAMPENFPERKKYEHLLAEMCAALAATQGSDGLWRASLLDPDSYPLGETSGSTFFCYGIAWAINHGVVDRATYLPIARKAWKGLMACVEPDGKLGYVQLPADSPRSPTYRKKNVEYATGAFLAAGAEMLQLLDSAPTEVSKQEKSK